MINLLDTLIIIIVIVISTVIIVTQQQQFYERRIFEIVKTRSKALQKGGACDVSCHALDPVSDPKYNMQQIIKQSILLEEHLANKNKRCRDCITKHFLHIIGLAEEAQMLATNRIHEYPLINESVVLYNELFDRWIRHYNTEQENNILFCMDKLRDHRKSLIVIYFFDEKYKLQKEQNES
jgi:hypothetical protein